MPQYEAAIPPAVSTFSDESDLIEHCTCAIAGYCHGSPVAAKQVAGKIADRVELISK